jgi:hypothetical protein
VQGTWLPTSSTIAEFEQKLPAALEAKFDQTVGATRTPFQHYYLQYGGLIVDGKRIVYANAFDQRHLELPARLKPPRPEPDWQHVAVNVCDGWTMFFGAEYDVESKRVQNLTFNGQAVE